MAGYWAKFIFLPHRSIALVILFRFPFCPNIFFNTILLCSSVNGGGGVAHFIPTHQNVYSTIPSLCSLVGEFKFREF